MNVEPQTMFEEALDEAFRRKWHMPRQRGPHHCGKPMEYITLPSGRQMLACVVCRKRRFT